MLGPSVCPVWQLNCLPTPTPSLRVIEIDGNPWFVAADVCRTLGVYVRNDGTINTSMALRMVLGSDEGRVLKPVEANRIGFSGVKGHGVAMVSESGLYKLVIRSDKVDARPFQDWVTRVVLPAIRNRAPGMGRLLHPG